MRYYSCALFSALLLNACGVETPNLKKESCSQDNKPECYQNEISKLTQSEADYRAQKDFVSAARTRLQINKLTEMSESDFGKPQEETARKYAILDQALESQISEYRASARHIEESGVQANYELSDALHPTPDFSTAYHPLVLEEVKKVFADFGDLYINETKDASGKTVAQEVKTKNRPWAGFWYPFDNTTLYEGENSPLAKYDQVLQKMGIKSQSALSEKERRKGLRTDTWEGMCDAWSMAASVVKEPSQGKVVKGIYFSIADQKALFTFSHLKYDNKKYGISYRGDARTDGTFQDIKPEAFHRIVTKVIGEEGRSVVIDDSAGTQVWSKPLFRYLWKVEKDPKADYAFLVKAYPWLIKERSSETDVLTTLKDTIAPSYTYRLYVDKQTIKNGGYKVIAGQWTESSFNDHPDTVTYPFPKGKIGSQNSEFNKNLESFKELFLDK